MKLTTDTWFAELETGISAMDLDHKTLLALVNRVIVASNEPDLVG